MRIDLVTVIAQAVNFVVLVLLLRRFLFRPVAAAIAERQRLVAERLAEAEERQAQAAAESDELARERATLGAERTRLLDQAAAEAEAERARLLEEARTAVTDAERRWRTDLGREQRQFVAAARLELAQCAELVARRALRDLADEELQARVVRTFLARVRTIDESTRAGFAEAEEALTVSTAVPLDAPVQAEVDAALHAVFGASARVRFETHPDLVCGIRLRVPGRVLGWSIDDYLESLHTRIAQLLDEAAAPAAEADVNAR